VEDHLTFSPINANSMSSTLNLSVLAVVLGTTCVSLVNTWTGSPKGSTCKQGPVKTFNPLSLPKDTTAREPFLDPIALFSDKVYVVRAVPGENYHVARNARFVGGEHALVSHLKAQVLQHIAPGIGWLEPPVVHFNVDASGAPIRVELVKTSGNAALDVALVKIFQGMPRWEPATTAEGIIIPQAFQFTVGQGGC
jgi:hypothetical protein